MWTLLQVENVEQYIERMQEHIIMAESIYKLLVKELREDANFRHADEIILALTGQGTTTSTTPVATSEDDHAIDDHAIVLYR